MDSEKLSNKRNAIIAMWAVSFIVMQASSYIMQAEILSGMAQTISVAVFLVSIAIWFWVLAQFLAFGDKMKASGKDKVLADDWMRHLRDRSCFYAYGILTASIGIWHMLAHWFPIEQKAAGISLITIAVSAPVFIFLFLDNKSKSAEDA